jgi:hypothetical protein
VLHISLKHFITPLKSDSCKEVFSFQILAAIDGAQTNETKALLYRDILLFFVRKEQKMIHKCRQSLIALDQETDSSPPPPQPGSN